MTKKIVAAAVEEDEHREFSLQDLLAASNRIDGNVAVDTELQEKEVAKEQFGLVEVGEVKTAKGGSSKVEKELREQIAGLETEVKDGVELAFEKDQRIADLEGLLTERDEQIARLVEQLEALSNQSEPPTETADTAPVSTIPKPPAKVAGEEPNPFA